MIHIAVVLKPYLELILTGEKTIECRMTRHACAPFERIEPGERIFFKQSAGPFRAEAVADHVICESNLTPRRLREIQRDYNEYIRGDDAIWRRKQDSRYITLIWLRDVKPTDTGPALPPLQGRGWAMLPEEPAWRRRERSGRSFAVTVTPGNLRHGSLYVTEFVDRFPPAAMGGRTRTESAAPLTFILHDGPTIETDIVRDRKLLRARAWGCWYRQHGVKAGDQVVFTPVDEMTYLVGLCRS